MLACGGELCRISRVSLCVVNFHMIRCSKLGWNATGLPPQYFSLLGQFKYLDCRVEFMPGGVTYHGNPRHK